MRLNLNLNENFTKGGKKGYIPTLSMLTFSQWLTLICVMCFLHKLLVHLSKETETLPCFGSMLRTWLSQATTSLENATKVHKIDLIFTDLQWKKQAQNVCWDLLHNIPFHREDMRVSCDNNGMKSWAWICIRHVHQKSHVFYCLHLLSLVT